MVDKKISALNALESPAIGDILPIVDIDLSETKKITLESLANFIESTALTFTAGSIPFAGTDGLLTQDNANLFWNNTTKALTLKGNFSLQAITDSTTGFQLLDADGGTPILNVDFVNERVGIGTSAPSEKLHIGGNTYISSDVSGYLCGAGKDMRIRYDGTQGDINSSLIAPSDILFSCGTDKTIVLNETVYDDFLPSVSVLATGVNSPDTVNHTVQSVVGSYYAFDGNTTEERLTIKIELLHGYKEGSDVEIHVHAMPSTTGAGDVIWYFDYYKSPINGAPLVGGTLSGTSTIVANTQYYDYTQSLGTITGTGLKIGDFIIGTLRRTPAGAGDTYAGDMLLKQVAAHCEKDTMGSRQRYIK